VEVFVKEAFNHHAHNIVVQEELEHYGWVSVTAPQSFVGDNVSIIVPHNATSPPNTTYTTSITNTTNAPPTNTTVVYPDAWRVMAQSTVSDKAWDVQQLKLLNATGMAIDIGEYMCKVYDSGSAGPEYNSSNAFQNGNGSFWRGLKDPTANVFYIGIGGCQRPLPEVKSVDIVQDTNENGTSSVIIESSNGGMIWTSRGKFEALMIGGAKAATPAHISVALFY
jgi:hypothetical protein